MYIFSTEYIFLKPKDQTNEHEQKKKQMNQKKRGCTCIQQIYTCIYFLYVFNNIYTHHKHLKINKKQTKFIR